MKKVDIASIIGTVFLVFIWSVLPPKDSYAEQPPNIVSVKIPKDKSKIDNDIESLLQMDKKFDSKYVQSRKQEIIYKHKLELKIKKQDSEIKKLNKQLDTLFILSQSNTVKLKADTVYTSKRKKIILQRLFNN